MVPKDEQKDMYAGMNHVLCIAMHVQKTVISTAVIITAPNVKLMRSRHMCATAVTTGVTAMMTDISMMLKWQIKSQ